MHRVRFQAMTSSNSRELKLDSKSPETCIAFLQKLLQSTDVTLKQHMLADAALRFESDKFAGKLGQGVGGGV